MANVEDLSVYWRAHELVLDVYRVTSRFPQSETYGLAAQMRRSAASAPMNLAEGSGRDSDRELARFVGIAPGSITELRYQIRLSRDLGLIDVEAYDRLSTEADHIGKMLRGIRRAITRSKTSAAKARATTETIEGSD